jgi:YgiT-type zinc finger domain-containing protein
MAEKICNFCGNSEYIEKHVEYVYRHHGHYMVFRDVPAEVCLRCGMRYFAAKVILAIEKRFFEIYDEHRQPTQTVTVPVETFV